MCLIRLHKWKGWQLLCQLPNLKTILIVLLIQIWGLLIYKWYISIYTHFARIKFVSLWSSGRIYPMDEFCLLRIGKFLINDLLLGSYPYGATRCYWSGPIVPLMGWGSPVCHTGLSNRLGSFLLFVWSMHKFESVAFLVNINSFS